MPPLLPALLLVIVRIDCPLVSALELFFTLIAPPAITPSLLSNVTVVFIAKVILDLSSEYAAPPNHAVFAINVITELPPILTKDLEIRQRAPPL